ncbi:hypothetical protein VCRA2120E57_110069 [Vibrio crassostreae]|nr:hypothetical protein VCRA2120E57_110069 [Vibrio crassostreae]
MTKGSLVILNPLKAFVTFVSIYTDSKFKFKSKNLDIYLIQTSLLGGDV